MIKMAHSDISFTGTVITILFLTLEANMELITIPELYELCKLI